VAQVPFMVRLPHVDLEAQRLALVLEPPGDVVERVRAVDFGLAQAEQVQVRPVDDIDFVGHRLPLRRWRGHSHKGSEGQKVSNAGCPENSSNSMMTAPACGQSPPEWMHP